MTGEGGHENTCWSDSNKLSQAAAEGGREAGPGARWPTVSPGPPGGRHGQAGSAGLKVVVVPCEDISISGNFYRNK